MEFRFDGLTNALTGFGGVQDRTESDFFNFSYMRPDVELSAIWASGGIGRKICSARPDDMVRAWINFPGDSEGKILAAMDKLSVRTHVKELLYWTELYRGGILVMGGLDNSLDMKEPARISKGSQLKWIKVYSAPKILNTEADLVQDANSPYYEDFDAFRIHRQYIVQGQQSEAIVHRSRCILSKGIPAPQDRDTKYEHTYHYWGLSRLQVVFQELAKSGTAMKAFGNLLHESTIATFAMEGLGEILANEDTAAAKLKAVMDSIARSKSVLNMLLTGPNDKFSRDTLNTSGWSDVAMMLRQEVAAVADSTVPRLYGIPSSGLGGGGSDEESGKNYDDSIQADQETRLRPILQELTRYIAPTVGMDPEERFEFNPLSTPTPKEQAEIREINSRTHKNYVDMGAITEIEVRDSVFGGDRYSADIVLDPSLSEEDLDPDPEPAPVAPATKIAMPKAPKGK